MHFLTALESRPDISVESGHYAGKKSDTMSRRLALRQHPPRTPVCVHSWKLDEVQVLRFLRGHRRRPGGLLRRRRPCEAMGLSMLGDDGAAFRWPRYWRFHRQVEPHRTTHACNASKRDDPTASHDGQGLQPT